jgi:long-chain acyl-CoA synthetase
MVYQNLYEVRQIRDLREMISSSVELFGDKAAFLVKRKDNPDYIPISYRQFKADIDALGTALMDLGLKDKKIAIIGENRYEWCVSYLAILCGTGIAVPLDKELPVNEIEMLIRRSEADAIIFSGLLSESIEAISNDIKGPRYYINMDGTDSEGWSLSYQSLIDRGNKLLSEGNKALAEASINPEVMNVLLFTSGTTDRSKAVMLSQKNICENLMNMCAMTYIDDKDTFLSVLPLHHTYECTCGFLCQMYRGCTVAFCEGLRHIVKNLKESRCTVMNGVPLIFESIYKQIFNQAAKKKGGAAILKTALKVSNGLRKIGIDLRKKLFKKIHEGLGGHIRLFISGAAAIDPLVSKGFRDMGIALIQGYGLTECSPIVTLNRDILFKHDSAGLPLPNLEVKIANAGEDRVGEIICKGSSVMLGYYQDEEATRAVIRDGWFYTGDLGFIDEDGFIHITGRKKNIIVTKNGKNIYPEEIETLLGRSPYIKESLVFGKEDEDGDVVVNAIIVPNGEKIEEDIREETAPGTNAYDIISKEVKNVNKQLVLYKHIKHFDLRDQEFKKTTTRKIKRYQELKQ